MAFAPSKPAATLPMEAPNALRAILWGGLIAGVLDITAAIVTTILRGSRPARMLQSIASGVLGTRSFEGGLKTSTLGLMLHFVIALGNRRLLRGEPQTLNPCPAGDRQWLALRHCGLLLHEPGRVGSCV